MIACVCRVVRLSLAVAFVSGLGLAATNANAQFVDVDEVCADFESLASNFGDEENWDDFGDVSNCSKICKSYVNKCKAFSKNWHSCAKKAVSDEAELDRKAFCDPLSGDERKECKGSVNDDEKADKEEAKSIKEELLSFCDNIEDDCTDVCENGIPALE